METFLVPAVVITVQLWILEEDHGKWNHMFHYRGDDRKDLLIAHTGDEPLGREGESLRVLLQNLKCDQVLAKSSKSVGDRSYPGGAYICTVDGATR